MLRRRKTGTVATAFPSRAVCAEPLEERLLCALSKAAGGSGYSGTLSTNTAVRQQQLICDPNEPLQGSTSVSYDTTQVTLSGFEPGPGYDNESFQVLVEVRPLFTEGPPTTELVPFSQFDDSRSSLVETGYVQVKYQLSGDAGQLPIAEGYTFNDHAGVDGIDTDALFFDPVVPPITINSEISVAAAAEVPPTLPNTTYTVFAAHGGTHSGNDEDFFITTDGIRIGPDEISPAVVTANPIAGAPVASLAVPVQTSNGPIDVTMSATDVSPQDSHAGFTYLLDWGDGSPQLTVPATFDNGTGVPAHHEYQDVGTFTITLTATDQHGQASAPVSKTVTIGGANLGPDPSDPCALALFVNGSSGNDVIRFGDVGYGHTVTINGHVFGPFDNFERIIVHGGDGNDDVRILTQSGHPAVFFGDAGNDTLIAKNEPAILDGGDGDDPLVSGGGFDDVVIGGRGADLLRGGGGQDVVVAGQTSFDGGSLNDVRALTNIQREWTGPNTYAARIKHITGTAAGGANGTSFFKLSGTGQTVFDDGAADNLDGGAGRDWLIFDSGTDTTDMALNETGSLI